MPRVRQLQPCFVEEVPSEISDGILYIWPTIAVAAGAVRVLSLR
jgi:hypothetical protein